MCETPKNALQQQQQHGSYNLTAVAMFALERKSLREYVHHYIGEGVDHFLLIDNNGNRSDESCEIEPFISTGIVTLIKDHTRAAERKGVYVIWEHLKPFLARTEWVLNADLDEFAYSRMAGAMPAETIWDFLMRLPSSVFACYLPWKHFGSAGVVQPPAIATQITRRWPNGLDCIDVKWIARSSAVRASGNKHARIDRHVLGVTSSRAPNNCSSIFADLSCYEDARTIKANCSDDNYSIHLNHYYLQSRESYYLSKMRRRRPDNPADSYGWGRYARYDTLASVPDLELQRKRMLTISYVQMRMDTMFCEQRAGGTVPAWCRRVASLAW